jgi:hypothetical protein
MDCFIHFWLTASAQFCSWYLQGDWCTFLIHSMWVTRLADLGKQPGSSLFLFHLQTVSNCVWWTLQANWPHLCSFTTQRKCVFLFSIILMQTDLFLCPFFTQCVSNFLWLTFESRLTSSVSISDSQKVRNSACWSSANRLTFIFDSQNVCNYICWPLHWPH